MQRSSSLVSISSGLQAADTGPRVRDIEVGGCAGQLHRIPCSPRTSCYHSLVLLLLDGEGSASLACLDSLFWCPLVITVHLLLCNLSFSFFIKYLQLTRRDSLVKLP